MRLLVTVLLLLSCPLVALPGTWSEAIESSVLVLMNQNRTKRGLPSYAPDPSLAAAARVHSQDMARFNFFDHDSPVRGHREVNDRVVASGGKDGNFGENLYWSSGLSEPRISSSVIAEWLSSPEHRETMLSTDYSRAGVGAFHRGKEYWVTLVCEE